MESIAHLSGVSDLTEKLERIGSPKMAKKLASRAARKAMNIVKKAAVSNAKLIDDVDTSEQISRNITVRASRVRNSNEIVMKVGVRGGARHYVSSKENVRSGRAGKSYKTLGSKNNPGGDTWYWWFVELGTNYSRAIPFLRPAMNNNIEAVTDTFTSTFKAGIEEELNKV